jgi:hypothetical protein
MSFEKLVNRAGILSSAVFWIVMGANVVPAPLANSTPLIRGPAKTTQRRGNFVYPGILPEFEDYIIRIVAIACIVVYDDRYAVRHAIQDALWSAAATLCA